MECKKLGVGSLATDFFDANGKRLAIYVKKCTSARCITEEMVQASLLSLKQHMEMSSISGDDGAVTHFLQHLRGKCMVRSSYTCIQPCIKTPLVHVKDSLESNCIDIVTELLHVDEKLNALSKQQKESCHDLSTQKQAVEGALLASAAFNKGVQCGKFTMKPYQTRQNVRRVTMKSMKSIANTILKDITHVDTSVINWDDVMKSLMTTISNHEQQGVTLHKRIRIVKNGK